MGLLAVFAIRIDCEERRPAIVTLHDEFDLSYFNLNRFTMRCDYPNGEHYGAPVNVPVRESYVITTYNFPQTVQLSRLNPSLGSARSILALQHILNSGSKSKFASSIQSFPSLSAIQTHTMNPTSSTDARSASKVVIPLPRHERSP